MAPDLKDHKRIRYLTENASISGGEENINKNKEGEEKRNKEMEDGETEEKGKKKKILS